MVDETRYDPLNIDALHRRVADVPITLDGLRNFCDTYGLPGRETRGYSIIPEGIRQGCAWTYLVHMVTKVQTLVRLYDSIRGPFPERRIAELLNSRQVPEFAKDAGGNLDWIAMLAERVGVTPPDWDEPTVVIRSATSQRRTFAHYNLALELQPYEGLVGQGPYQGSNSPELMKIFLVDQVNNELQEGTYLTIDRSLDGGTRAAFRDLVGAIYIHFARELAGEIIDLRRCPSCQEWFVPKHGRQRFCEDKCKSRHRRAELKKKQVEVDG